ncbi:MAG: hypothetical protein ACOYO1_06045 [Bacteroidales bacterium]
MYKTNLLLSQKYLSIIKHCIVIAVVLSLNIDFAVAQVTNLSPGKERWEIKTSVPEHSRHFFVSIDTLLMLPSPIMDYSHQLYNTKRIPNKVSFGNLQLQEGDIITTRAYVHLVALEKDKKGADGDYHIQVLSGNQWTDSCLIIEVPYPEFVKDPALKEQIEKVRNFVNKHLLENKYYKTKGLVIDPPLYVNITGQLFFDGNHYKQSLKGKYRGKSDHKTKRTMKSYTLWELHPVTEMKKVK